MGEYAPALQLLRTVLSLRRAQISPEAFERMSLDELEGVRNIGSRSLAILAAVKREPDAPDSVWFKFALDPHRTNHRGEIISMWSAADGLTGLTEREREVLSQRFEAGMGLKEISKAHGVSRERIRQIIASGQHKIRHLYPYTQRFGPRPQDGDDVARFRAHAGIDPAD